MIKNLSIAITLLLTMSISACNSPKNNDTPETNNSNKGSDIEVFYFHSSHRCATCMAVEKVTVDALNELYTDEMKSKKITFQSINLDETEGEELAKKMKVSGQTLLFIQGDHRLNLTNDAFMNARKNPDKLKIKIKKTVDRML